MQVSMGTNGPVSNILLGLYGTAGKYQTGLISIYTREDRSYLGDSLGFISGESIRLIDVLDLGGASRTVNVHKVKLGDKFDIDESTISVMKKPALLLCITRDEGRKEQILILASISPTPQLLWQETVTSIGEDGGGYSVVGMALEPGEDETLVIRLTGTCASTQSSEKLHARPSSFSEIHDERWSLSTC
jgi:hypothetical protein